MLNKGDIQSKFQGIYRIRGYISPLFSIYKDFYINKGGMYIYAVYRTPYLLLLQFLNNQYSGSLVLFDENIFTSSVLPMYIKKRSIALEINKKKLLWSLVPIIKPEYCKVSTKYDKQAKRSYIYMSHFYFKFSAIIV